MNRPTLSILVLTAVPLVGCASTAKYDLAQNPYHEAQGVRPKVIGCCGCSLFDLPDILRYQILETTYWLVVLNPFDQLYLGRSVIILKRHAPTLATVTDAEWVDYKQLAGVFATAASRAFDAEPPPSPRLWGLCGGVGSTVLIGTASHAAQVRNNAGLLRILTTRLRSFNPRVQGSSP